MKKKKSKRINHGTCNVMLEKLKVADNRIGFALLTPVYEGNKMDKEMTRLLLEAKERISCVRVKLQDRIVLDLGLNHQLPKGI